MEHSPVERRLRSDIEQRHKLRNKLEKKRSLIAELTRKLEHTKKNRLNNRYSTTIERVRAETETLRHELNKMNMDLQKRITEEMKFSEEEIQNFEKQYQKEYADLVETEEKLKAIEEGTTEPDVEEASEEGTVPREAIVARTRRMLKRERRVVEEIQREMDSEERDRGLFARELRQIMAELSEGTSPLSKPQGL